MTDPNILAGAITREPAADRYAASDDNVKAWLNDGEVIVYGKGSQQVESLCRRAIADRAEITRLREWLEGIRDYGTQTQAADPGDVLHRLTQIISAAIRALNGDAESDYRLPNEEGEVMLKAMNDGMTIHGTISLGALIDRLTTAAPEGRVFYDFCDTTPRGIDSYRGYYDHLALGWSSDIRTLADQTAVKDLLAILRSAIGGTFHGWKGGEYVMNRDSPVWVDNSGECSSTAIVGVSVENEDRDWVYILTARVP